MKNSNNGKEKNTLQQCTFLQFSLNAVRDTKIEFHLVLIRSSSRVLLDDDNPF